MNSRDIILYNKLMDKQQELKKIAHEIEQCVVCKKKSIGKAVPGEGNPDADIMFVGEAPGRTEAATGRPFVGRSGKLLRKLINEADLKEQEVYITSPVKYLPVYGTPKKEDIEHGRKYMERQIAVIQPKIIVLLGSVAVQAILGEKIPVSTHHGEVIEREGKTYFITVHPAAALRFTKMRDMLLADFKKLKSLVAS